MFLTLDPERTTVDSGEGFPVVVTVHGCVPDSEVTLSLLLPERSGCNFVDGDRLAKRLHTSKSASTPRVTFRLTVAAERTRSRSARTFTQVTVRATDGRSADETFMRLTLR